MSGPMTGRHVGRKLADLMHDARVAAAHKIIPAEVAHRAEYHRAFMEATEQELAPTIKAACQHVLDDETIPEEAKAMLRGAMEPEHQGQFFLVVASIIGIAMSGPAAAAEGLLQILKMNSLKRWPNVPLSPDQMALGFIKGEVTGQELVDEAVWSGVSAQRAVLLSRIAGEPPGPQQLGEALRRGYIDTERFAHGIRQGRIKNEWIDVMERLRFAPPSAGEAIAAAVQGHLSPDDSRRHFAEAGIDPGNWQWMFDTAGRPPGAQEMIQLLRRGKVDEATVRQAIRESDIKNKYIDAIVELQHVVPPQRTVVSGLRQGAVDDAQARTWLNQLGYPPAAVDMLVKEAHSTKGTNAREISLAETLSLYNEGLVDRGRAHAMLVALRFDDASAEELIQLADVMREHKVVAASVARVRSAYLGHKIRRNEASTALDALHMDGPSRDHALALWDIEHTTQVRHLTEAQVVKAWKKGALTDEQFVERHLAMGYTEDDARLLLAIDA